MLLSTAAIFAQGSNSLAERNFSPAELAIAQATKLIGKNPKDFEAYNALALAMSRRAREMSDVRFYAQGEEALHQSFEISPDNFDGKRIQVWLLLGKHEFASALEEAKKLNKKAPDDVMVYGFLTDANVELGNYEDAEVATQWMLNLRPANLPGLTRAAYLRELYGDVEGALELMNMAYQSTPPSELEDAAWILTQMAHLKLAVGKTEEAETLLEQALLRFPGYHYALGNLAKVRIAQRRFREAVDLLQQRYRAAMHAENLYDLAEALELAGRSDEAKAAFQQFEAKSLLESAQADNSNRELIFYYADHAHQPGKALEVAQHEFNVRHDVYTLDAYAWALHLNGRDAEARKQVECALAVGIRDAKLLRRAGEIAISLGDRVAAEHYWQLSAALNAPGSAEAIVALASLNHGQASK
jgi:tetratricopeptide (TPR) repeat protein